MLTVVNLISSRNRCRELDWLRKREKERRNSHGAVNFSFSDTYGLLRQEAFYFILLLHLLLNNFYLFIWILFSSCFSYSDGCLVLLLNTSRNSDSWSFGSTGNLKRRTGSSIQSMFVIAVLRGLSTFEEGAGFLFARLISQYFLVWSFSKESGLRWTINLYSCVFPSCFCCIRFGILRRIKRGLSMIAV